jgi:lysozyme family protein
MAKVELLAPILFKWEGGYQCDPSDRGNYNSRGELVGTKYGVSAKACEEYYHAIPSKNIMENLTPEKASFVLLKYWQGCKADLINNQSVANLLVDYYYNSGAVAIQKVQGLLGLKVDGIVGDKTISAINASDQKLLFAQLWNVREKYYQGIVHNKPTFAKFLKGWLNRLNDYKYSE